MIIATLLTFEQKEILIGKNWSADAFFNPIQDIDNNWVIFAAERNTNIEEFQWLKNCPQIEYVPKPFIIN